MAYNSLTQDEKDVILDKGTERPFTGEYDDFYREGIYICKRCNNPLFDSKAKFDAKCGWPAFDEHLEGAVQMAPDPDGSRTEIICAKCKAHLGHVFTREGFTPLDTRHCVNSLSLKFIATTSSPKTS